MKFNYKPLALVAVFALASVAATGCDFVEGINTDPDAATEVPGDLLFPTAIANLGSNRTIEVGPGQNFFAQYYVSTGSASVFFNAERYTISPFTTGNTWSNYYTSVIKNLGLLIDQAENGATVRNNNAAQAKLLSAFTYYALTVQWGDVPFSQANNPSEFPNPEFDSQQQVLQGIVALVDEALAQIDTNDPVSVANGDVIYGGDMSLWRRFGNSLKLNALVLLRAGGQNVDAQIQALINNPNLIRTNASNAEIPFDATSPNPFRRLLDLYGGGNQVFIFAGETIVNPMNQLSDPRRDVYFQPFALDGGGNPVYSGGESGRVDNYGQASRIGTALAQPDTPERLITAAQTLLLEAEFLADTGNLVAADAKYRAGIQASMEYWGIPQGETNAYLLAQAPLTTLTSNNAVDAVQLQLYIAMYGRGTDGWTLVRRTDPAPGNGDDGTPSRTVPVGSNLGNAFINRLPYPPDEVSANPNTPAPRPLSDPMFFQTPGSSN